MSKIEEFSKTRNMVRLDGAPDNWFWLTPKVQQFTSNFQVGQEVEYESNEANNRKTITFMKALGETKGETQKSPSSSPSAAHKSSTSEFICKDCGATMKNGDYETCYKCSMARREKEKNSPEGMEKQKSIRSQAIGHMVSRSLISLQGSVDINNIMSIIDTLFEHYNKNISKLENS